MEATVCPPPGHNAQVTIKFKCPAAPMARHFFVLLYRDRYQSQLVETWQARRVQGSGCGFRARG